MTVLAHSHSHAAQIGTHCQPCRIRYTMELRMRCRSSSSARGFIRPPAAPASLSLTRLGYGCRPMVACIRSSSSVSSIGTSQSQVNLHRRPRVFRVQRQEQ